jgi:sarcosine oxidase subunit gamma
MIEARTWSEEAALAGIALPRANRAAVSGNVVALWLGPHRYLLAGPGLRHQLEACGAALVDQSDARVVVRIAGPRGRDVLAKGTGIDLARLAANDVASTLLGDIAVILHAADTEAVDLYVPRSYALTLWEWLLDAAEEYGTRIEPRAF